MVICACGCNQEIPYFAHHSWKPPKYIRYHYQRKQSANKGNRISARRIPAGGTYCACGCGQFIPEFKPCGEPRYSRSKDGKFYVSGHNPLPTGNSHHNWKGGKYISNGYVRVLFPEHARTDQDSYVLEHILIWEHIHGPLNPNEEIHHINGDRSDNRIENLIALTKHMHHKLHYSQQGRIPRTQEQHQIASRLGAKARWGLPPYVVGGAKAPVP